MDAALERLTLQCLHWDIQLQPSQISLLGQYADLLADYELANVIGTRDRATIIEDHLLDSLSCFTLIDARRAHTLIDVGTGAGLPGIPLAIARSHLQVTLLEATEKKARFLQHACRTLGLANTTVLHARAEQAGREQEHREDYDLATARALASLPVVVEYCAPLVRAGGAVLAMKASLSPEELTQGALASRQLGLALNEIRQVSYLPQLQNKERRLVVLHKVRTTPARFPRRLGLAKKRPLGINKSASR